MHSTPSGPQWRGRSSPRPHTAVLLLDLERVLKEQLDLGGATYQRRLEIEAQLSDVRGELERRGFAPSK